MSRFALFLCFYDCIAACFPNCHFHTENRVAKKWAFSSRTKKKEKIKIFAVNF